MKKSFVAAALCFGILCFGIMAAPVAQGETVIPITNFDDSFDWAWTGGNIEASFVDVPWDFEAVNGEHALSVFYSNSGEWGYQSMEFPIDPIDITGAREIRMSVYFAPGSTGELRIRLDLPQGDFLGFAYVPGDGDGNPITGEWHELSWPIDRYSSQRHDALGLFNGFIVPTPAGASGEVWIDNIYAVIPDEVPEVEEFTLFDFSEGDPVTYEPYHWTVWNYVSPEVGDGLVPPTVGLDTMMFFAGSGWDENIRTTNVKGLFDRWQDVVEVIFDIRMMESVPGGWIQSTLIIASGVADDPETTLETWLNEQGFNDTVEEWKTLGHEVDLISHLSNIEHPDGWLEFRILTQNAAEAEGHFIFIDRKSVV